jgi:hypothetical protein
VGLVDPDVPDVERRAVDDLQGVVTLDRRDVLRLDEVVTLDLPRLERLEARGVVGDRLEDQPVQLRLLAPVVVVADEDELVVPRPRLELERAGPDRVLGAERPGRAEARLLVDRALVGVELLERLRAREREVRQGERAEERGGRLRQRDDDGRVVLGLAAPEEAFLLTVGEAAESAAKPVVILSSDTDDMRKLAQRIHGEVRIERV